MRCREAANGEQENAWKVKGEGHDRRFEDEMIHSLGNPKSPILLDAPKRRLAPNSPACESK